MEKSPEEAGYGTEQSMHKRLPLPHVPHQHHMSSGTQGRLSQLSHESLSVNLLPLGSCVEHFAHSVAGEAVTCSFSSHSKSPRKGLRSGLGQSKLLEVGGCYDWLSLD